VILGTPLLKGTEACQIQGDSMAPEQATARKAPQSVLTAPERLLDSEEAAAITKIHPKTLQRLARQKISRGVQIGRIGVSAPLKSKRGISKSLPVDEIDYLETVGKNRKFLIGPLNLYF
jgi:hypothetical protein